MWYDRSVSQVRILLLAANHREGDRLALDREVREIEAKLRASRHRDAIDLRAKAAVRADDLMQALSEHEPHIVHFCGHGSPSGELMLVDDDGDARPVDGGALSRVFRLMSEHTRLVVFNACFSRSQADAVIEHIDCAVGMNAALSDHAGVVFAAELYRAIGFGRSIAHAFEQAVAALALHGLAEEDIPELMVRTLPGGKAVDAHETFLLRDEQTVTEPADRDRDRGARPPSRAGLGAMRYRWYLGIAVLVLVAWSLLVQTFCRPRPVPSEFAHMAGGQVEAFDEPDAGSRPLPFEFAHGAGVLLACPRHAGDEVATACAQMSEALERMGEPYVQTVKLPHLGADAEQLVAMARSARASLVAMIAEGERTPRLRVLPVPGTRGQRIVEAIPHLDIAREDTRRVLAPILFALAWSAAREPTALPPDIELAMPNAAHVGDEVAVLAMYLHDLTGRPDDTWVPEAHQPLRRIVKQCEGTASQGFDTFCALARYLLYGRVCPDCLGAMGWLDEVARRGPDSIGAGAMIDVLAQHCSDRPDEVASVLDRLHDDWEERPCLRLALAVPASCLVIKSDEGDARITHLASPRFDEYAACGDLRTRVLAQRAYMYSEAGRWREAARDYGRAAGLAPDEPIYLLDWAAATLQAQPTAPDLTARIKKRLDSYPFDAGHRVWADFLTWLADPGRADRLCRDYRDVLPPGEVPVPDLGPLGDTLCSREQDLSCRVYRLLSTPKPKHEAGAAALCEALLGTSGVPGE